jgi:hypothetical protein
VAEDCKVGFEPAAYPELSPRAPASTFPLIFATNSLLLLQFRRVQDNLKST